MGRFVGAIGHGGKVQGPSDQSDVFYRANEWRPPHKRVPNAKYHGRFAVWPIAGPLWGNNLSAMAAKCRAVVPNLSAMAVKALVSGRSGGKTVARGARSPTGHRTRIQPKKQKCITNGAILLHESWPDLGWAGLGWPGLA